MVGELRAAGRAASTVKNVIVPIHLMYAELAESYPDLDNPAVKLSRLLGDKRRGRQLQTVPLTPGAISLRGEVEGQQFGWDTEAHAEAVKAWRDGIKAKLDRIIAGLRELVSTSGQKGAR